MELRGEPGPEGRYGAPLCAVKKDGLSLKVVGTESVLDDFARPKCQAKENLTMTTRSMIEARNLVKRYDYHEHGGAPLLGIDGICIICHGSSSDRAIEQALAVAAKHDRAHLNAMIVQAMEAAPVTSTNEAQ